MTFPHPSIGVLYMTLVFVSVIVIIMALSQLNTTISNIKAYYKLPRRNRKNKK